MITIYSTPTCGACKKAKEFMKNNGIDYEEKDITQDPTAYALLMKLNIRSVPLIYVDDKNYTVGFSADKVLELAKK